MSYFAGDSTASLRVKLQGRQQVAAEANSVNRSLQSMQTQAKRTNQEVGRLDQSLKTMGAFRWLSYAGFATVATAIGGITREALTFEDAMAKVRATTGATGPQFENLWTGTLELAQQFRATGAEAANGLYEITAAGIGAADAMMVLKGSLALAAATGYDQAESGKLMVGLMNNFNMTASETITIADMLYKATAISGIGMEDLGYTLKYLQGPARLANQSLAEILEQVALLGRLNMRGQNVGTGLATGLVNLAAPAPEAIERLKQMGLTFKVFQTAKGQLLPLTKIIEKVVELTGKMTDVEKFGFIEDVFGKDSIDVWATLINAYRTNLDLVNKNKDEFKDFAGSSAEAATIMNDTVTGALERLWGAITQITTTKFMTERGPIQEWIDSITAKVQAFDLPKWLDDNREGIQRLVETGQKSWDFGVKFGAVLVAMSEAMAPTLLPILEVFGGILETMASHSAVLTPLVYALTGMWVAAKLAALAGALTVPLPGGGGGVPGTGGGGVPTPIPVGRLSRLSTMAKFGIAALIIGSTVEASDLVSQAIEDWTGWSPADSEIGQKGLAELTYDQVMRDSNPVTYPGRRWGIRGGFGAPSSEFTPSTPVDFAGPHRVRASDFLPAGFGMPAPVHVSVEIDGKELATAVTRYFNDATARR